MKKKANINEQNCDRSPFCPVKRVCPVGAVKQEKGGGLFGMGGKVTVDKEKCTGCGICTQYCPMGAVSIN